jgi:hypothetical protein
MNLTAADKAKIRNYSQEYLEQANKKCLEARVLVHKSSETGNPELMFTR